MLDQSRFNRRGEHETHGRALSEAIVRRLHLIHIQLNRTDSMAEFCRSVIVLGHRELGFDRLGLWLLNSDRSLQIGTFGIDEYGGLRDERKFRLPVERVVFGIEPGGAWLDDNKSLNGLNGRFIANVSYLCTTIWDGSELVGYLGVDNLLSRKQVTQADARLLAAYGRMLSGPWKSRKGIDWSGRSSLR
jgi:hypothetical protein